MKAFPHYIREVGRPYQWAQRLAGLQFLKDSTDPPRAETSLSAIHMEETIKQMRGRVDARLALQKQLTALGWYIDYTEFRVQRVRSLQAPSYNE